MQTRRLTGLIKCQLPCVVIERASFVGQQRLSGCPASASRERTGPRKPPSLADSKGRSRLNKAGANVGTRREALHASQVAGVQAVERAGHGAQHAFERVLSCVLASYQPINYSICKVAGSHDFAAVHAVSVYQPKPAWFSETCRLSRVTQDPYARAPGV